MYELQGLHGGKWSVAYRSSDYAAVVEQYWMCRDLLSGEYRIVRVMPDPVPDPKPVAPTDQETTRG